MSENKSRTTKCHFYRPASQVVIEAFEQGTLVLRLNDQHLIELNPIASAILAESDGQHSVAQVAATLAEAYKIPETEVCQDALALYEQLLIQGIVEPVAPVGKDGLLKKPRPKDELLYFQNPVVIQNLDEESTLLFNPDSNQVKFVNNTGISCWKLCDGTHGLTSITSKLQQSMKDVPADTLAADVREFISDLLKADFIRTTTPAHGRG